MENNTLCNRHSLGVNNHTKMYVTYTRIYGWSDYGGESSYQPGYRLENMMWMTLLVYDYIIPGESNINIDLSKDAILVCAWNKQRFVDALLNIGQNVGNSFEYDKTNHMATYIFPIGLTIVYNGNHSSLSGILKGEGTIQANQTYDLVPTYDYMYFDGIYFRNKINDEKLYKVERFEIGALYEIGRLLAENGIR